MAQNDREDYYRVRFHVNIQDSFQNLGCRGQVSIFENQGVKAAKKSQQNQDSGPNMALARFRSDPGVVQINLELFERLNNLFRCFPPDPRHIRDLLDA